MCGIVGFVSVRNQPVLAAENQLRRMSKQIRHRGPDGDGIWIGDNSIAGFAHRRLAIIDLTPSGSQPMVGSCGRVITYNGEVYNYPELKQKLAGKYAFRSSSDTETILAAFDTYGEHVCDHLRGMFAFAIWDPRERSMFCARDPFGIKPFYYTVQQDTLYFASEIKALVPILETVEIDREGLSEYLVLQYPISDRTLFRGVRQLLPGHSLSVTNGCVRIRKYWDVTYSYHDWTPAAAADRLRELLEDSVQFHLRSDVPVGAYLSGGVDSSLIALLATKHKREPIMAFHGKFTEFPGYDESQFARAAAQHGRIDLHEVDITATDFLKNIESVIYHLDQPVAGPGSFPQYMVSQLASRHRKVVLGGQGGDEIFAGYARYLVGHLERALNGAIDDTAVKARPSLIEILPNLGSLREYKPLMSQFFSKDLFGPPAARYWRLCDRSSDMSEEIEWNEVDLEYVRDTFEDSFNATAQLPEGQQLDAMTRFDFKYLLPALLQVEDRMSMAHGIESRVPFLDTPLIEFAASLPPEVKLAGGQLKSLLREAFKGHLPDEIFGRRDKMGFPVPLKEWWNGGLRDYLHDTFGSSQAKSRAHLKADKILANLGKDSQFSRKTWGLLSLEIWFREFLDDSRKVQQDSLVEE